MDREDLKEIIVAVMAKMTENSGEEAPLTGCIFCDNQPDPCDVTTFYAVGEEG